MKIKHVPGAGNWHPNWYPWAYNAHDDTFYYGDLDGLHASLFLAMMDNPNYLHAAYVDDEHVVAGVYRLDGSAKVFGGNSAILPVNLDEIPGIIQSDIKQRTSGTHKTRPFCKINGEYYFGQHGDTHMNLYTSLPQEIRAHPNAQWGFRYDDGKEVNYSEMFPTLWEKPWLSHTASELDTQRFQNKEDMMNRQFRTSMPSGPYFYPDNGGPVLYLKWINTSFDERKTQEFMNLIQRVKAAGLPVYADFVDSRVRNVFNRRWSEHPGRLARSPW